MKPCPIPDITVSPGYHDVLVLRIFQAGDGILPATSSPISRPIFSPKPKRCNMESILLMPSKVAKL